MAFVCCYYIVPEEIESQGGEAQYAYLQALLDGFVNVYRGRILLIGQDRAGKTSLKESLTGRPFNPKQQSTEGIHIDPSTFEIDVDQVKNWQSVCENEHGLLGCSRDIAKIMTTKLPVYYPSLYSDELSDYDTVISEGWDQEDNSDSDSEYSENNYMKFTREDTDTEDENDDEKDESEEDQEIDDEDVDDNDTYSVEVEEEENADSLVNQVCQFTMLE